MKTLRPTRTLIIATAVAALAVSLTACSKNSDTPAPAASTPPATTASGPFGAACSAIPAAVAAAAPTVPVATAASQIPALSTLVSLVGAAGLANTLNTTPNITVFAPTNDAFGKVDAATLQALQADPTGKLANVLKYHVFAGDLTPEILAGSHTMLNGGQITITGAGQTFTVATSSNGTSNIVCGNVKTANARVYVIDTVLVPAA